MCNCVILHTVLENVLIIKQFLTVILKNRTLFPFIFTFQSIKSLSLALKLLTSCENWRRKILNRSIRFIGP